MSQAEVLKFLERNKKSWFTTDYLTEKFQIGSIPDNLRRLYKAKEIDRICLMLNEKRRYLVRWRNSLL